MATRRERFLAEMEAVVPWAALSDLIEPHCPKFDRGRPPNWQMSRYLILSEANLTVSLLGVGYGHDFPLGHCLQAMNLDLRGSAP